MLFWAESCLKTLVFPATDLPVVASGGVTTTEDVKRLAQTKMAGCIIGRALYEGTITIRGAIDAAN